jgi:hypothetical protein
MRFVPHGSLSPAVADALKRHEHQVVAPLESPDPGEFLKLAHKQQLDVVTTDGVLVDAIYAQKIPFGRAIVFLQLEGGDVEQDDAIDRLFTRYKRLTPGRLYTVTATRVKIRQLPSA